MDAQPASSTTVLVRYWAAARAAVGLTEEDVATAGTLSVARLREAVAARHPEAAGVLALCSLLVDDRPLGTADPATVEIPPGATVEFLPPSAGG